MTDIELGTSVIKKFWSYWKIKNPNVTFDQLLSMLKNRKPMGGDAFLDGLGFGVRSAEMSDSKIDSAMKLLAQSAGNQIPAKNGDFFQYLSNQSTKVTFVDQIKFAASAAVDTVGAVGGAVVDVGDKLLLTGKIVNFLLPAIGLFFLASYLNKATDGDLVKFASHAAKKLK